MTGKMDDMLSRPARHFQHKAILGQITLQHIQNRIAIAQRGGGELSGILGHARILA